jgi:hypothetical protein
MAAGEKHRRGQVALRVLHSLPPQHEKFFYREVRNLCTDFVTFLGIPRADRASAAGELLSDWRQAPIPLVEFQNRDIFKTIMH